MDKQLTKIKVRLEGDINTMWTFEYSDGTTEGYYAYEGSAQSNDDDRYVYDYDQKLDLLLDSLIYRATSPDDEFGCSETEFDRYLNTTKVEQFAAE